MRYVGLLPPSAPKTQQGFIKDHVLKVPGTAGVGMGRICPSTPRGEGRGQEGSFERWLLGEHPYFKTWVCFTKIKALCLSTHSTDSIHREG